MGTLVGLIFPPQVRARALPGHLHKLPEEHIYERKREKGVIKILGNTDKR